MNPYIAVGLNPVKLRKWIIESKYISVAHKQHNIIAAVCEYYKVEYYDLTTKSRKREFTEPRMIIIWLLRKYTNLSLKTIGAMFGNRDHSTMIYSTEAIKNLIDTDFKFLQKVRRIERTI
jgi:chromosomal replication initiation ATPase DnaA